MDIKIDVKDLKKFINFSALSRNIGIFLYNKIQIFMLFILVFMTVYLVFFWYTQIFHSEWDEARVNEYIKDKQNKSEAVFNRDNFQKVIDITNARSVEFEKTLDNTEDIFRLNK